MQTILSTLALFVATALAQTPVGYTGDMTYFDTGLGSCGVTNTDADAIVALAIPMMDNGANPNVNPLCGQTITINYGGQQHTATIVDTCQACAMDDIDLTPSLFAAVDPSGNGRVHDVNWWFDSTPDGSRPVTS